MVETDNTTPDQRLRRELALLRAANAPVVFFGMVGSHGCADGVGNITLIDGHHIVVDRTAVDDVRVAAQLRFPVSAIASIRLALDAVEKRHAEQTQPVPDALKN